jgi:hypothetical protein
LKIFARHALVEDSLGVDEAALLLEGTWPPQSIDRSRQARPASPTRTSLDETIDQRHAWIDAAAAQLAETAAGEIATAARPALAYDLHTLAYLNALKLRYLLVKLLRPAAYFAAMTPLPPSETVEWFVAAADDDYVDLLAALSAAHGWAKPACLHRANSVSNLFVWRNRHALALDWRRAAATLLRWSSRRNARRVGDRRPVVFCGNRHLLGGVCDELIRRGHAVDWLYDRFALKTWLRWRRHDVGQWICEADRGRAHHPLRSEELDPLICRGVELTEPVRQWLLRMARTQGSRQMQWLQRIDLHFARLRPSALLLDEDATPCARAAVLAARRRQVPSFVVQHGVPCVRFGFAPLAADGILTWGDASTRQLVDWGVPEVRVETVGCPRLENLPAVIRRKKIRLRTSAANDPPRILLLANVPPRDTRPDAVSFHLTERTYDGMLQMAAAAAIAVRARLLVKPHPRDRRCARLRRVLAGFPSLHWCIAVSRDLARLLADVDCVLSCASSAGVEAALAGLPVIQLMPAGSADLLPAERWGQIGTARTQRQLSGLLSVALRQRGAARPQNSAAFASLGRTAIARIADVVERGDRDQQGRREAALTPPTLARGEVHG